MAFCFSGSLLQADFNIVFSCFILLSFVFVANKFLLGLILFQKLEIVLYRTLRYVMLLCHLRQMLPRRKVGVA